ncbi:MAG: hypothetical protein WCR72_01885 [Bacteroidota bacterium]
MSKKKTVWGVLHSKLTEEELNRASRYIKVTDAAVECLSIDHAITSFQWSDTAEGKQYWQDVFNRPEFAQL